MFNINDVVEILRNNSSIAIPISLIISIVISLAGILPSVFITGANIVFFGPINGFFISLLGETIGAYITFIIYRLGFKRKIEKFTDRNRLISRIVKSDGREAGLLIFQGRIIPFIPSGIITFAASISNVDSTIFTVATLIGKVPSIALEALVSYDIININDNWIRLVITVIGLIFVKFTITKKKDDQVNK
ncbi:TVP38/TMEM64 family protein [Clostridium beijerinckii]|uniref:TVP38/TMEM64 family membrane protein n=1 Tax=Clostridium beijerinckii TaxID=1520 RepID=A0A9Q5CRK9_CLOBE|nr:VTT domain-containing protein [Clostridium beijerinckii]AQS05721.1 TVP38/TMEM64 family inner membrane protein YdjZ [Clostridium beijerinckii]MBA2885350.1 putative membrane protein YdjX (TVP38/TMEM64 family) [Clostridium beijerinckii]MBA2900149.1 putative membrane protein YdjX (TVP38/TMEM64 family) [Clostridium beijerinckii]MBA2909778.1 putative membrane protein YdjX (TVP38/TMEM64 family) [Clostridium beijerinckii]MBA9014684.1 putative membrane protein YdjX (TVP38/TMEM64 family) [Clostridium